MKKIFTLIVILSFSLTGCALFAPQDMTGEITNLKNRVSSIEDRQSFMETQLEEEENITYVAPPKPKARTTSKKTSKTKGPISDKISLTRKEVQTALKNAGYYDGAIDGKIGNRSKEGIKEFQLDHNLKVDGVVGLKTEEALLDYLYSK